MFEVKSRVKQEEIMIYITTYLMIYKNFFLDRPDGQRHVNINWRKYRARKAELEKLRIKQNTLKDLYDENRAKWERKYGRKKSRHSEKLHNQNARAELINKIDFAKSQLPSPKGKMFLNVRIYKILVLYIYSHHKFNSWIKVVHERIFTILSELNSQAPVTPELATRGVFRLSRLSVSSHSKTVKKYTLILSPKI